jgi:hypothetical protein
VLVSVLHRTSCACAYLWYTLGIGRLANRTSLAMTHAANLPRHQYVSVDKSIMSQGQVQGWEEAVWFGLE